MAKIENFSISLNNDLKIILRTPTKDDAKSVVKIGKHLMDDGEGMVIEGDEFTFDEEHEAKWIQDHLDTDTHIIIIVQDKKTNETIGILNFETQKRRRVSHTGELGMGIHKDYRALGIGKALLTEFLEWAKTNKKIEKINLRVFANNQKAIKMYKKAGFKEDGRKIKEIKLSENDYLDDISMQLIF